MQKILRYITHDIIKSCSQCAEIAPDELVKISLDGTSPLWPEYIIGTVCEVTRKEDGREYRIRFEEDDLNGGPLFSGCHIEVECWSCCDQNNEKFTEITDVLTESLTEAEQKIVVLENQMEQVNERVDNLETEIQNNAEHIYVLECKLRAIEEAALDCSLLPTI